MAARRTAATARRRAAPVTDPSARVTTTTKSVPAGNALQFLRKFSRSNRLIRLRTTAAPARRPTIRPRRTSRPAARPMWMAKGPEFARRPVLSARLKSAALRSRALRGKRFSLPLRPFTLPSAGASWPVGA